MNEQYNKFATKDSVLNEEFENFMYKVEEVRKLMNGLTSTDKTVSSEALKIADNYLLGSCNQKGVLENIDEDSLKIKTSRTVINQKVFDEMKNEEGKLTTQTPEAFMKSCELDSKRRAEERRMQKEASDTIKKQAVSAFKKQEFERALSLYNKAINEFRSSSHLYQCRALTCLKLNLYKRAIEDCDLVLRCFDKSLKALLYKAKAHRALGEEKLANQCVKDAITSHPKCENEIREYMSNKVASENSPLIEK